MTTRVVEILNWLEERFERRHDELSAVCVGVSCDDENVRSWRADYWAYRDLGGLFAEEVAEKASPIGFGSRAMNRLIRQASKEATDTDQPVWEASRDEIRVHFYRVMGWLEAGAAYNPGMGARAGVDQMLFLVPKVCEFIYKAKTPPVTPEFLEAVRLYVEGPKERNKPKDSLAEDDKQSFLNIIGALLGVIQGDVPGIAKHPHVTSQAKMIDAMVHHYEGFRGVSKRNLEGKFAAARRQLGEGQTTAGETGSP